ncbi:hypothetical protein MPTK1_7g05840 [Marchantia polymorpha subsp. ruderalis]|uniref:Uncharacterized protein n=2 Tax=Marchantia polymorpha TaxID=3197 RepID=A0AAF6BWK4_MARPO|nr:hypothetical protein MARPO_0057s0087 [Marchantia polymorpha]BBN16388.1 hypothetical protein Mp_7g05840 [Marchantia polymorpha subsp. ruderalis]|eukprot:PTQ37469.1 hypothetical protein MARPO_0057s0087 [Marchantia polymorpha]
MDVLGFYRDAPVDIQERLIQAMTCEVFGWWVYESKTRTIIVKNLHSLYNAVDCEEQCNLILLSVLSGIPRKIVVETSYTESFSHYQRILSYEKEIDVETKIWFCKKMLHRIPVEFVYNPHDGSQIMDSQEEQNYTLHDEGSSQNS